MKKRNILFAPLVLLILLIIVLAACAWQTSDLQPVTNADSTETAEMEGLSEIGGTESATGEGSATQEAVSHGNEIGGYVELVDALTAVGATVEPAGPVDQEFFEPTGQLIKVNGNDVQVFDYPDETARMSDSDKISADGSTIGTSMITWVDQPNFWVKDRLIVLFVGKDPEMIGLLDNILGESITTH